MKRSKFSLSHYKLLSCDMGYLVPIGLTEVLPGDTIQQATSMLLRVSPLLAPVMHPVQIRIHHWFVPHRLVWNEWEDFITGGPDGMNASVLPYKQGPTVTQGGLADYYGIPPGDYTGNDIRISALPFRGYNLIFNEWYRDQDLTAELPISKDSGQDTITTADMQRVAWEKDYFTSARPWTQKGPEITLPLGTVAPVRPIGGASNVSPEFTASGVTRQPLVVDSQGTYLNTAHFASGTPTADNTPIRWGSVTGLETDLSQASSVDINTLRKAFALQRYEEARARYGSRYTEYLRYLGVRSSDARLQRPEYLGGGKQTIQFSEVLQTAPAADSAVGDLKGHGIGAVRSNRYRRFFEEHGYIHTFLSVRPKTIYTQGVARTWLRKTKEDFFQKELQHIGQQEVLNSEIYADQAVQQTFGYQDRYDEYRRAESGVAGEFRNTLDFWHYARIFASPPVLNSEFVTCEPTKRVNAVQNQQVLWIMANHSIQARRMVAGSGKSYIF